MRERERETARGEEGGFETDQSCVGQPLMESFVHPREAVSPWRGFSSSAGNRWSRKELLGFGMGGRGELVSRRVTTPTRLLCSPIFPSRIHSFRASRHRCSPPGKDRRGRNQCEKAENCVGERAKDPNAYLRRPLCDFKFGFPYPLLFFSFSFQEI